MQTPHRFFAFFAGGAAGESSATTLGDFGSALDDSGVEASSSTLTGLADGMGNEVDGLTFMSAMESVTFFWLSESVEGRRVDDGLGISGFFSSLGTTVDAGAGAELVSRDCFSLKQTEQYPC